MPSFQDSAVLILLALLLFGPKKLPVLARQLGKLMADFRRASNEFRAQMEEELRIVEQADRQKQIAAIEAAAPAAPALASEPESDDVPPAEPSIASVLPTEHESALEPVPIATSGDLSIMPPSTGLPIANSPASDTSLAPFLDAIPEAPAPDSLLHAHAEPVYPEQLHAEPIENVDDAGGHSPVSTHEDALETETLHG